jgi:hypothetical protein
MAIEKKRMSHSTGPYSIVESAPGECIWEFMARPAATRRLFDIETAAQSPLVSAILFGEIVAYLARLREFL